MERDIGAAESNGNGHGAIFEKANPPISLKFENVVYKINVKTEAFLKKMKKERTKTGEKIILKGISGVVFPGEILAMLGPSGSGKTTLLTALGGRLGGFLTSTITYNGEAFSNVMKRKIGFVTQNDVQYPHLTVTESLVFTALLRLPNSLSKREKIEHAEAVITQLGLTKCKNSMIGNRLIRGISGGEKKRVSIGQEMLINPSLLLLDEPTSGLDSTTAQKIVSTMLNFASGGRTIVMAIHQPSSKLYQMFHKVLLLSEGNPIYFGKGVDAMDYFSGLGFIPNFPMNPADFLLDLANGVPGDESGDEQALVKNSLVLSFKTNIAKNLELELQKPNEKLRLQGLSGEDEYDQWTTTWWQQFSVLLERGVRERRRESYSGIKTGQVLFSAVLGGSLWWQTDIRDLQDKIAIFFFYSGFWGSFPLFNSIHTFPLERLNLEKERASGMYRLSSYFMARTAVDLPMELVLPTIFVVITYWMAGLKPTATNFFSCLLSLLYSVLVTQGLGLAVGALVMDLRSATRTASILLMVFSLVGGFYIQNVPRFLSWMKYFSINQYTYKLLVMSQYKPGETYPCSSTNGTCLVEDYPGVKSVGLHGLPVSLIAMSIMLVGYRLIAYVALMKIGSPRK